MAVEGGFFLDLVVQLWVQNIDIIGARQLPIGPSTNCHRHLAMLHLPLKLLTPVVRIPKQYHWKYIIIKMPFYS